MLVLSLSLPPFTRSLPSGSMAVPGQNMSCPVLLTVAWLTAPLARSSVAVCVKPWLPPKLSGWYADHVRTLPVDSIAAATGTIGKPVGASQRPTPVDGGVVVGGAVVGVVGPTVVEGCVTVPPAYPTRLISAALDHGPRLPASVNAVSRT